MELADQRPCEGNAPIETIMLNALQWSWPTSSQVRRYVFPKPTLGTLPQWSWPTNGQVSVTQLQCKDAYGTPQWSWPTSGQVRAREIWQG